MLTLRIPDQLFESNCGQDCTMYCRFTFMLILWEKKVVSGKQRKKKVEQTYSQKHEIGRFKNCQFHYSRQTERYRPAPPPGLQALQPGT